MTGHTPDAVLNQYFKLIGKPVLVPLYALGWNQCKWGYMNVSDLNQTVQGYISNNIPFDTQWSDIDYMEDYKNFEVDPVNYGQLPEFVDYLHSIGMRYVPILDAGISYRHNYEAFQSGLDKDIYMKLNGANFVGTVWPGDSVYPDYYAKNTVQWWHDHLTQLYQKVKFDGIWEDMNEASNFCNGPCYDY